MTGWSGFQSSYIPKRKNQIVKSISYCIYDAGMGIQIKKPELYRAEEVAPWLSTHKASLFEG